jgi:flagellin
MSVINSNIQAMVAARNLSTSQEMLGRSLNRMSSGSKIVNPSDDAAGLAVSEKLDAQSRRVKAATTNVQNAVSFVQTADGFMSGMTKILSRMSELRHPREGRHEKRDRRRPLPKGIHCAPGPAARHDRRFDG